MLRSERLDLGLDASVQFDPPSNSDGHRDLFEHTFRPCFGAYFCCAALLNAYGSALESPRAYLLDEYGTKVRAMGAQKL